MATKTVKSLLAEGNVVVYPATVANFVGTEIPAIQLKEIGNKSKNIENIFLFFWIEQKQQFPLSGGSAFTAERRLSVALADAGIAENKAEASAKMEIKIKLDVASNNYKWIRNLFMEYGKRGESTYNNGNYMTSYTLKAKELLNNNGSKSEIAKAVKATMKLVDILNNNLKATASVIGREFSYFEGLPIMRGSKSGGTSVNSLLTSIKNSYKENNIFSSYSEAFLVNHNESFGKEGFIAIPQEDVRKSYSVSQLVDNICNLVAGSNEDIIKVLVDNTPSLAKNKEFLTIANSIVE